MYTVPLERDHATWVAFLASVAMWIIFCTATLHGLFVPQGVAATAVVPVVAEVPDADHVRESDDVLWLARCIYSETKRPEEQELVAWVVRNRVETRYRGKSTYRDVVLDPMQFSAFNSNSPRRTHYMSLDETSSLRGFQRALRIARWVMTAEPIERPFSTRTRHFYSERSMPDGAVPAWAVDAQPVALDRPIDPRRFRFFDRVV